MGLIKNSTWNLAGYVLPTLIAIPAMGYLARALGIERFGIYTLAIAIVGYAGIFDIGLTRAIVREIAVYRNNAAERKRIISTATIFLFCFSLFGSIIISLFSSEIISLLNISTSNYNDVQNSIRILVWTIPAFLLNQLWMSILEGDERFAILNVQRSFGSSIIAGLPALFVLISPSLFSAILGLAFGRLISMVIAFLIVKNEIINAGFNFYKETFRRMIFLGGWITVSNIISPVMVYFDRFIISGSLGASHVGYYTASSEIISRFGLIPGALSRALFPKLSSIKNQSELKRNIIYSYLVMGLCCLPLVIISIILAGTIITVWLGSSYALQSESIFRVLLIGFFFNSIAQIPFTVIQSIGKAKYTAFLHCIEVIPYLILLFYCVDSYGVLGAAYAWAIRVFVDCILLILISNKCIKILK